MNDATLSTVSPSLKIARLYQPQTAALDALVEVLQLLLFDGSGASNALPIVPPEPTCFPKPPE
jgi:hypothetical protein